MARSDISILTSEYRPCMVNNKKALFHRWIEVSKIYLSFDKVCDYDMMNFVKGKFDEYHVIPKGVDANKIVVTLALVEFEDGSVEEVNPTFVRFMDHGKFEEYAWVENKE